MGVIRGDTLKILNHEKFFVVLENQHFNLTNPQPRPIPPHLSTSFRPPRLPRGAPPCLPRSTYHTKHQSHTQHNTKQHLRPSLTISHFTSIILPLYNLHPITHPPPTPPPNPLTLPPPTPQNPHLTQPLPPNKPAPNSAT